MANIKDAKFIIVVAYSYKKMNMTTYFNKDLAKVLKEAINDTSDSINEDRVAPKFQVKNVGENILLKCMELDCEESVLATNLEKVELHLGAILRGLNNEIRVGAKIIAL